MENIIVFEQKNYMMERIIAILEHMPCQIQLAKNYFELEDSLNEENAEIDIIIAELNFDNEQEILMISTFLENYPNTKLIIFTTDQTRKAFLDSIKVGASDYIIHTSSDLDISERLQQYIDTQPTDLVPTHLLLNLNKYISGEMIKAKKGGYELTIVFSTVINENGLLILKEDTSFIATHFSNNYWDTDSIVIYGYNHMLSFFPFCTQNMIEVLDKKLQHIFARCKAENIHMGKFVLQNTYVTFPEEGLSVDDILRIVRKKIELSSKK